MVEGEGQAPVAGIHDDGRPGVVRAPGNAGGPGQEDRRDGVEAGVPRGIRVRAELPDELDVERGLLAGLPDGGRLERLAVIDEAAGQSPAGGRVLPLDQDDAPAPAAIPDLDDDVDGRERIAVFRAGHRTAGFRSHCRGRAQGCQFGKWGRFGRLRPHPATIPDGQARRPGGAFGTKGATIMDVNGPLTGERS